MFYRCECVVEVDGACRFTDVIFLVGDCDDCFYVFFFVVFVFGLTCMCGSGCM